MGAVGKGANLRVGCCHKKVEPFGSRILAVFELGECPGGRGVRFPPASCRFAFGSPRAGRAAWGGVSRCLRAFRGA